MEELQKVKKTTLFLMDHHFGESEIGIILGTGLETLIHEIKEVKSLAYSEIPYFPTSTVEFHKGKLIYGWLEGKKIVAMQGRFHFYEGHSMDQVAFPVRVMKYLGVNRLLVSNAAGCMNPNWKKGELMLIEDHINLMPDSPLRGKDATAFGSIFTDMSQPYDSVMNEKIKVIATEKNIRLHSGVYVSVLGPNLETKAEYRFLRLIGADVVGMSTVPEVIAANQLNLPVSVLSVLTDECDPDNLKPIKIEEVLSVAKKAEKNLVIIIKELVKIL